MLHVVVVGREIGEGDSMSEDRIEKIHGVKDLGNSR